MSGLGDAYSFYYPEEAWQQLQDDEEEYARHRRADAGQPRGFVGHHHARIPGYSRGSCRHQKGRLPDGGGYQVTTATMQDAVNLMRGIPGEKVHIEIVRNGR